MLQNAEKPEKKEQKKAATGDKKEETKKAPVEAKAAHSDQRKSFGGGGTFRKGGGDYRRGLKRSDNPDVIYGRDIEEDAIAAGVTAFCAKPMFMSDLRETLLAALGEKQEKEDKGALPESVSNFNNKHILLVEDNELNSEIAQEILSSYGFNVDVAENGAVAVHKVENSNNKYDLVLMDVQMPIINGYEATKAIRELDDPQLSNIPILAMTANAFDEDRKNALDSGMNGFISKPIDMEELVHALENIFK